MRLITADVLKRIDAVAARAMVVSAVIPDFVDQTFPVQERFLGDSCQLIAALCTRRAAKSFSAAKRLLRAMYRHPGASCLFIALTRSSAKKILWKDVLKVINRRWKLGAVFNETELSMKLPNGSILYLLGVDTNEDEKEKLLGQKYAEVCIDESASYSINLHELVYGVLKPAVADYRGTICLVGTPGNLKSGLFFELTEGHDPSVPETWQKNGWSCHCWSTLENPYMREIWLAEIAQLVADNPLIEQTPSFQQNYLGRWVIDETALVYRYAMGRNDFDGTLPLVHRGEWHFVIAIDLGFNDACSFTAMAYHDHLRDLYVLESTKESRLDITATAQRGNALRTKYGAETVVVDGANKQAVEEMNRRHGLGAETADKTGKADFIDIMNAEYIQERIKLSPDCQPLKAEYSKLIWDERALKKRPAKRVENPACENHCTDGTLYGWRYCWQYLSVPVKPPAEKQTQAYFAEQQAAELKQLEESFETALAKNQQTQRDEAVDEQWL